MMTAALIDPSTIACSIASREGNTRGTNWPPATMSASSRRLAAVSTSS
jgi:hypothetical protein